MLFAFPYALAGLAALVGLVAIYTFRARFRRRPVSSLMLWQQTVRPRQGGLHRDRLRLPPLFYLELAVLAALVAAALGPHVLRPGLGALTVVFDTSVSMTARDASGASAQDRAVRAMRTEVRGSRYARVRLILAGAGGPESAGTVPPAQAAARLAETVCLGPSDTLEASLARACELSEKTDDVLVLTDRPPPGGDALRPGVRWLAFGSIEANTGITYADRSRRDGGAEALLVEVAGFARPEGTRSPVRITALAKDGEQTLFEGAVDLSNGGRGRLTLDLPPDTPALSVALQPDALETDNRAMLLPVTPRPVASAVRIADAGLRRTVERALAATGRFRADASAPQIVFTDRAAEDSSAANAPWQVVFTAPAAPRLVRGPYLADRSHPLLEGLSFDGLVWPAGTNTLPGRVLLFAGSSPLLSFDAPPRRAPVMHLVTTGAGDALYRTAAWPALIWNLAQACAEAQPGPASRNLRAGVAAPFMAGRGATEAVFDTPGDTLTLRTHAGRAIWAPPVPGLYRMRLPDGGTEPFAVNLFAPGESDLRGRMTGHWSGAQDGERLQRTHRSFAWLPGLAALLLAGIHHGVLGRKTIDTASTTGRT
jgi:hypothetical protein